MKQITSKRFDNLIARNVSVIIAGAFAVIILGIAVAAHADAKPFNSGVAVNIAGNGQVHVKGARVTAVSSSTITAQASIGGTNLNFSVVSDNSTEFVGGKGSATSTGAVKAGDIINFSGTLDGTASFTVHAKVIRDISIPPSITASIKGTLSSVNVASSTLVASTGNGSITIALATGATITLDGNAVAFGSVQVGQRFSASGTLDTSTKIFTADKIVLKSAGDEDKDRNKGEDKDKKDKKDKKERATSTPAKNILKFLFDGRGFFHFEK